MDLKLQGRVVAITGGASGIGRSCALRYLEEGCRVAVCGRNRAKLEVFRRHCREAGHEVLCVEADVADTEALERFADTAVSHFGRLDVWYNNAGMGMSSSGSMVSSSGSHHASASLRRVSRR